MFQSIRIADYRRVELGLGMFVWQQIPRKSAGSLRDIKGGTFDYRGEYSSNVEE